MDDIMSSHRLQQGCPVLMFKIPPQIMKEIDEWVKVSRRYKDHPLRELRAHENVGYLAMDGKVHNTYQCSIPPYLIEKSFWLGWVLKLSARYWGMDRTHHYFKLRKHDGHFDGYDIWANFAYKGDDNPCHNHAAHISGVIYYKNHGHPTIFPDYKCGYDGKDGTMVMFPANTLHLVEKQTTNKERITFAFNICRKNKEDIEF